jgi:hypothetical protein
VNESENEWMGLNREMQRVEGKSDTIIRQWDGVVKRMRSDDERDDSHAFCQTLEAIDCKRY